MPLDRIQLQANFGGPWPFPDDADPLLQQLAAARNLAMEIASEFRDEQAKLRQGGELTQAGMDQRLSLLAHQQLDRLGGQATKVLAHAARDRADAAGKLERVMQAPPNDASRTQWELFILQRLFALAEPERVAVLRLALADGEDAVLTAVLNAPVFIQQQLALPITLDEIRMTRAERAEPARVRWLRELDTATQLVESAVSAARKLITETPGLSDASKASIFDIALPTMAQAA